MANVKQGNLTGAREWWQHLRRFGKRDFWKGERQAQKAAIAAEVDAHAIATDSGDTANRQGCGKCAVCECSGKVVGKSHGQART